MIELLSAPVLSSIPAQPLAIAAVPAALVPMRFPWMRLPSAFCSSTPCQPPENPFPEMTLPAPAAAPPMVLLLELATQIPVSPLPIAAEPGGVRPDVVALDDVAGSTARAVDVDAVDAVAGDDVAVGRVGAADGVAAGLQPDPPVVVAGDAAVPFAFGADVVALDDDARVGADDDAGAAVAEVPPTPKRLMMRP